MHHTGWRDIERKKRMVFLSIKEHGKGAYASLTASMGIRDLEKWTDTRSCSILKEDVFSGKTALFQPLVILISSRMASIASLEKREEEIGRKEDGLPKTPRKRHVYPSMPSWPVPFFPQGLPSVLSRSPSLQKMTLLPPSPRNVQFLTSLAPNDEPSSCKWSKRFLRETWQWHMSLCLLDNFSNQLSKNPILDLVSHSFIFLLISIKQYYYNKNNIKKLYKIFSELFKTGFISCYCFGIYVFGHFYMLFIIFIVYYIFRKKF